MSTSAEPPLAHVLYISRALTHFSDAALGSLFESARRFNAQHDLTGLLLYDHVKPAELAQFCQYVEGPPHAVAAVRKRIESDTRHTGIAVLFEGRCAERLFSTWSMGFENIAYVPAGLHGRQQITLLTANAVQVPGNVSAALLRSFVSLSQTVRG